MEHSDRKTLRNLLLNTLYYYNCQEKVEAMAGKLKKDGGKKEEKKETDSHHSEDIGLGDELSAAKALQAIDDHAYSVHFVL